MHSTVCAKVHNVNMLHIVIACGKHSAYWMCKSYFGYTKQLQTHKGCMCFGQEDALLQQIYLWLEQYATRFHSNLYQTAFFLLHEEQMYD